MMNASIKEIARRTACEVLYWSSVAYLIYLCVTLLSFFVHDHSDFVSFFTSRYPDAFRVSEYGLKFFTEEHYQFVRSFAPFLVAIIVAAIVMMLWKRQIVTDWITGLFSDVSWFVYIIRDSFRGLSSSRRWIFFACMGCLISIQVYMLGVLSPYGDAFFNFEYFAKKGIFHSSVYSNTQMLSNIISAFWLQVGLSPEIAFRLTSMLSATAIYIILFSVVTYYFDFRTGLIAMIVTGVTLCFNLYAVQGVAYKLMSVFALIALTALTAMVKQNRGDYLFIISCVLGLCASRLFIIPLISFLIIHVCMARDGRILRSFVGIAVVATLLYLPMYLWSGEFLFFFKEVPSHDLVQKSPLLFEIFSFITEVNSKSYYVVIGLVIAALVFFRRCDEKTRFLIILGLATIASILVFTILFKVYPPSRMFVYANIFFNTIAAIIIVRLVKENIVLCSLMIALKIASTVYLWNYGWQTGSALHHPTELAPKFFN